MRTVIFSVFLAAAACGTKAPADPQTAPSPSAAANGENGKWEGATAENLQSRGPHGPGAGAAPAKSPEQAARRTDEYDKEQTEIALKRAARQVKDNCGHAKEDTGKASGPWGKVSVSVVLGHNGHSKGATIPGPYEGKAVGRCAVQAFTNLVFPPWGGADTTVDWEVEIVQPGSAAAPKQKMSPKEKATPSL